MRIVHKHPPNYDEIKKVFPIVDTKKGVIYTYGNVIFNPDNGELDDPLLLHEATHSLQQDEMGPKKWWDKYLKDPDFRLSQEIEAYQNQYRAFTDFVSDKNKRARYLLLIANDLASSQYGNIISYSDAVKRIKNYLS